MDIHDKNYLDKDVGVYNYNNNLISLDVSDINKLKKNVCKTKNKRIRICLHDDTDKIHEMIILLNKKTYIRPAKHLNKSESLHVICGKAIAVFFDNDGDILYVNKLNKYPYTTFMYRMNTDIYHTLIVESEYFIFHEVTNGPFNKANTIEANWSPKETDINESIKFLKNTRRKIKDYL